MVSVVNSNDVDLLLNSVSSAVRSGVDVTRPPEQEHIIKIYISQDIYIYQVSNLVVFAADAASEAALTACGIAAFRHEALGAFAAAAAESVFGDRAFVDMMWLKIVSMYLVNALRYDALFFDADVVFYADPWPALYASGADSASTQTPALARKKEATRQALRLVLMGTRVECGMRTTHQD